MKWNKSALLLHTMLLTFSVSFAACNNNSNRQTETVTEDTTQPDSPAAATPAADYEVTFMDEDGKKVSLESLKGKVVFINFWATWCPPCIHEMPSINKLKQSFDADDEIIFLMVDVDGKLDKSTAFMEKNEYDLTVYAPESQIPSDFLGRAIPTTVILDKTGAMVGRIEGGRDYSAPEIKQALEELIEL